MTTITGKEHICLFRMVTMQKALKLEIAGIKRRGRTVYSMVKEEYGLKGSKQKVYEEFTKLCNAEKERLGYDNQSS